MMARAETRVGRLLAGCIATALAVPLSSTIASKGGLPRTEGWIEARTPHFTIYSNASEGRTRRIAVRLERFRQALGR